MTDIIVTIAFYAIAIFCIVGVMGVVFNRNIVHSAAMLFMTFLGIAGLYIILNSDFVAMSQILIYSIGVVIIIVFAIMLTDPTSMQVGILKRPRSLISLLASFSLLIIFFLAIFNDPFLRQTPSDLTIDRYMNEGTTGIIGRVLFTDYVLPFEIISILLLVAIIGAVILAKRRLEPNNEE